MRGTWVRQHAVLLVLAAMMAWSGAAARGQAVAPAHSPSRSLDPSAPSSGAGGIIRFRAASLPAPGATDPASIGARNVLRAFQQRYPQYEVDPFTMPTIGGKGLDAGPLMAIAAGVPPNAIYVNFRMSSTFIEHGFLQPVEVLLARVLSKNPRERQTDSQGKWLADPTSAEAAHALALIRQRVPKPAWPVVYREGTDGAKHAWAVPINTLVMALLYRKDLFYAAGLDPEKPPTTWHELLVDARKLTVPSKRQYGLGMVGGMAVSWGTYSFLVSSGARAVKRDANGQWKAAFDTQRAAEAYYFLWQLVHGDFKRDGKVIHGAAHLVSGPDIERMWDQGRLGMRFNYLDQEMLGDINPQLIGIAPVPASPNGGEGSELNCMMLGAFSESSPEVQLAVMRYIWFITSDAAQRIRVQTFVNQGFGQFVTPDLLKKFGYDRLLRQIPKGWAQAFNEALEHGVPEPYGHNTQNIYEYLSTPINTTLATDLSAMPRDQALAYIQAQFAKAAHRVNYELLGNIPDSVMRTRRIVALAVVLLGGLIFFIGLLRVWRHFSRISAAAHENRRFRQYVWGYILLLPVFALVLMWAYIPLVGGLGMAFTDYELVRHSTFVGLDNFANVLFDRRFWEAMGRTFYFVALVIGLGFWPPILLGILLQEVPTETLKYFFRTVYYLPAIVSGVIIMFLWRQLYNPTAYGTLNQLLMSVNALGPATATLVKLLFLAFWLTLIGFCFMLPFKVEEMAKPFKALLWGVGLLLVGVSIYPFYAAIVGAASASGAAGQAGMVLSHLVGRFHIQPLQWIESPQLAMLCVVLPIVWASAGPGSILYLAALKTVPDDLYEAADIDGASAWHKVFYITLPRLKFLIIIQFIAAVIAAFKGGTDYILALTGGGPNYVTMILALKIFFTTFLHLSFGIGTAMAWILGAVLIWFTANQLKMLARAEFKAEGPKT